MIFRIRTLFLRLHFHLKFCLCSEKFNDHVDDSLNSLALKFLGYPPWGQNVHTCGVLQLSTSTFVILHFNSPCIIISFLPSKGAVLSLFLLSRYPGVSTVANLLSPVFTICVLSCIVVYFNNERKTNTQPSWLPQTTHTLALPNFFFFFLKAYQWTQLLSISPLFYTET